MRDEGQEYVYYVYAVVRARAGEVAASLLMAGILPEAAVFTVACRDLLGVVSRVPLAEFGPEVLEAKLEDVGWVEARVVGHQATLAGLLDGYTLAPLRFCTLCRDEAQVQALLARHYGQFDELLQQLEGATEWGVKVYGSRQQLLKVVAENSPALEPLRQRTAAAAPGAAHFLRKQLEQAAEVEARRLVNACCERSHQRLAAGARQAVTNPVHPSQVHQREDEMFLNGAYLVDNAAEAQFRQTVDELAGQYTGQGFHYELTGPWPPYNFSAINSEQ